MTDVFTPNKGQAIALDALRRGENVFLTGGAGTGKTALIKHFINEVDPDCEHTVLMAPTGKAALNLTINGHRGSTIHRIFRLKGGVTGHFKSSDVPQIIKAADRIIVDEISMMRIDLFDYVGDAYLEEASNFIREWEGRNLQLILVGDFYQLPPVITTNISEGLSDKEILDKRYGDVGKAYCFQAPMWNYLDIKTYELTEVMRQKGDARFCEALNKIRVGDPSGITYINDNRDRSAWAPDAITLCGTNKKAQEINENNLKRNPNPEKCFHWRVNSDLPDDRQIRVLQNVNCVEELHLKVGAKVICLANCESAKNGEMGEIVSIDEAQKRIRVAWQRGETNIIEPYKWEITRQTVKENADGKMVIVSTPILSVTQIPLKLAYAITIHKAQGETFESANVYVNTFETGHLYTALSRCKNVHKMRLSRLIREEDVLYDKAINDFYGGHKE